MRSKLSSYSSSGTGRYTGQAAWLAALTICACLFIFGGLPNAAQRLPIKSYTISEGLAHNNIRRIFQDAKGYLWLATAEGLSRFDGYSFANYGKAEGLAGTYLNDITSDASGQMWVAINDGGIARFLDEPDTAGGSRRFVSYTISETPQANNVNQFAFDDVGRLWCATEAGIFRSRGNAVANGDFEFVDTGITPVATRNVFAAGDGSLWFGFRNGVLRVDGDSQTYHELEPGKDTSVTGVTGNDGILVASTRHSLYSLIDQRWQKLDLELSKDQVIQTIAPAVDGGVWIGTNIGLIKYRQGTQTFYSSKNGLSADMVMTVFTDRDKGLWIGTIGGGLSYRSNNAIVDYSSLLPTQSAKSFRLTSDIQGNIYIKSGCMQERVRISAIRDSGIAAIPFPDVRAPECRKNHFFQDRSGRWWFLAPDGLRVATRSDLSGSNRVVLPNGQSVTAFHEMIEDRDGKVWLAAGDGQIFVADSRQAGTPRFELAAAGVKAGFMLADSRGTLWLANNIFLGRLRNGIIDQIETLGGVVDAVQPRSLFEDSKGRIWIGTRYDGVLYTDDPESENPTFKKLGSLEGLTSSSVWSIAEDDLGGIYLGTGRGVDRYDTATGRIRHFINADGVSESAINHLLRDRRGHIWIASDSGVSRIDPSELKTGSLPPPVFISKIMIAGETLPIADTGVADLDAGNLGPAQNNISIRYVGLDLKGEHSLSYQYLLEGYDKDWVSTDAKREVAFANLGSGDYRFLVRAADMNGVISETPAAFHFRIMPPVWQRWWFLLSIGVIGGLVLYSIYRYRLGRAVELERVRTRIATDLHDDIGSNLTRISLLSEVLNQRTHPDGDKMLASIADIARESVGSMNDIVWAISPTNDRLLDLTRRMRQHAEEVFTTRDVDLVFETSPSYHERILSVGVRRDILLIFKEAVNNAARHSSCTKVEIGLFCSRDTLRLSIEDNGKGFERGEGGDGNGLSSMHRRANNLGGTLTIDSDRGTSVVFEMPLSGTKEKAT